MTPQQSQPGIRQDFQDIPASTTLAHVATLGPVVSHRARRCGSSGTASNSSSA